MNIDQDLNKVSQNDDDLCNIGRSRTTEGSQIVSDVSKSEISVNTHVYDSHDTDILPFPKPQDNDLLDKDNHTKRRKKPTQYSKESDMIKLDKSKARDEVEKS